jgi:hypothetical protein
MKPQVMVSSVTKDRVPLGNVGKLAGVWLESEKLRDRLKAAGLKSDAETLVPFEFIRSEIKRHLVGKYAWEVYLFEDKAGQRSGEHDTLDATKESQLVIGIFGQDTGWQVGDHDPLTPTEKAEFQRRCEGFPPGGRIQLPLTKYRERPVKSYEPWWIT